jgi:hypothetical protein
VGDLPLAPPEQQDDLSERLAEQRKVYTNAYAAVCWNWTDVLYDYPPGAGKLVAIQVRLAVSVESHEASSMLAALAARTDRRADGYSVVAGTHFQYRVCATVWRQYERSEQVYFRYYYGPVPPCDPPSAWVIGPETGRKQRYWRPGRRTCTGIQRGDILTFDNGGQLSYGIPVTNSVTDAATFEQYDPGDAQALADTSGVPVEVGWDSPGDAAHVAWESTLPEGAHPSEDHRPLQVLRTFQPAGGRR